MPTSISAAIVPPPETDVSNTPPVEAGSTTTNDPAVKLALHRLDLQIKLATRAHDETKQIAAAREAAALLGQRRENPFAGYGTLTMGESIPDFICNCGQFRYTSASPGVIKKHLRKEHGAAFEA